jgi:hypothetical protein
MDGKEPDDTHSQPIMGQNCQDNVYLEDAVKKCAASDVHETGTDFGSTCNAFWAFDESAAYPRRTCPKVWDGEYGLAPRDEPNGKMYSCDITPTGSLTEICVQFTCEFTDSCYTDPRFESATADDDFGSIGAQTCTKEPKAARTDQGYPDAFRGWYDVTGQGCCNDYCRWVGDSGSGGDPSVQTETGTSWWSCAMAGTDVEYGQRPQNGGWGLSGFTATKCSGEGAISDTLPSGSGSTWSTETADGVSADCSAPQAPEFTAARAALYCGQSFGWGSTGTAPVTDTPGGLTFRCTYGTKTKGAAEAIYLDTGLTVSSGIQSNYATVPACM